MSFFLVKTGTFQDRTSIFCDTNEWASLCKTIDSYVLSPSEGTMTRVMVALALWSGSQNNDFKRFLQLRGLCRDFIEELFQELQKYPNPELARETITYAFKAPAAPPRHQNEARIWEEAVGHRSVKPPIRNGNGPASIGTVQGQADWGANGSENLETDRQFRHAQLQTQRDQPGQPDKVDSNQAQFATNRKK